MSKIGDGLWEMESVYDITAHTQNAPETTQANKAAIKACCHLPRPRLSRSNEECMGRKMEGTMARVNHEGEPEKQLSKVATARQFSVAPSNKMTNIRIASTANLQPHTFDSDY